MYDNVLFVAYRALISETIESKHLERMCIAKLAMNISYITADASRCALMPFSSHMSFLAQCNF